MKSEENKGNGEQQQLYKQPGVLNEIKMVRMTGKNNNEWQKEKLKRMFKAQKRKKIKRQMMERMDGRYRGRHRKTRCPLVEDKNMS